MCPRNQRPGSTSRKRQRACRRAEESEVHWRLQPWTSAAVDRWCRRAIVRERRLACTPLVGDREGNSTEVGTGLPRIVRTKGDPDRVVTLPASAIDALRRVQRDVAEARQRPRSVQEFTIRVNAAEGGSRVTPRGVARRSNSAATCTNWFRVGVTEAYGSGTTMSPSGVTPSFDATKSERIWLSTASFRDM